MERGRKGAGRNKEGKQRRQVTTARTEVGTRDKVTNADPLRER